MGHQQKWGKVASLSFIKIKNYLEKGKRAIWSQEPHMCAEPNSFRWGTVYAIQLHRYMCSWIFQRNYLIAPRYSTSLNIWVNGHSNILAWMNWRRLFHSWKKHPEKIRKILLKTWRYPYLFPPVNLGNVGMASGTSMPRDMDQDQ
jgi:hypothetical protein